MWARYFELSLALWLGLSPFIMQHGRATWHWVHDLGFAALIAVLALLSFRPGRERSHLWLLAVSAWLVGFGWWHAHGHPDGGPAVYQNWIVVGLVLLLFAVVPSSASTPPKKTEDF